MSERAFFLKLAAVIVIKVVLLAGLWVVFVKDARVHVDTGGVAHHLNSSDS